jgi:hypothetical protein
MAGILFYFQDCYTDVFSGTRDHLDAWRYAVKAGGIDKIRCINTSGMDASIGFGDMDFEFVDEDWIKDQTNIAILDTEWTCPSGAIPLSELDHSEVDWYVFGAAHGHSIKSGQFVYLPMNGRAALHSLHIASAVLLRRWEEVG